MNLRFVWHIVRKDARRLWWMIVLTVALLARMVHFDSMRAYATPGIDEGWLNILLPLAWSLLIALALLEDPVIGETPFWATVPCRWPSLLAAKAVLILIFIHLPYLVACAYVLQARGFPPLEYLPDLFARQLVLLAVTAGSLALATMVRNVTQFMVVAIALATAVVAPSLTNYGGDTEQAQMLLTVGIVTVAAVWIALFQYAQRKTRTARTIGTVAVVLAAAIWWAPRERLYGFESMLSPAPATAGEVSVHLADPSTVSPENIARSYGLRFGMASVAVPITVSGLRANTHIRFFGYGPELLDAAGNRYSAEFTGAPRGAPTCCGNLVPYWQVLSIHPSIYERLDNAPLAMKGSMLVDYYRPLEPVVVPITHDVAVTRELRCYSELPVRDNPSDESPHVECESPNRLPGIPVKLLDTAGNREWTQYLGSSRSLISYPTGTWLSPINRIDTFFPLTDEEHYSVKGGEWLVPHEIVQSLRVVIAPEIPEGSSVVSYEIPNIILSHFLVKP